MRVTKSEESLLEFDNGLEITGDYSGDCCEYNYLDFEQLPVGTELPDMTAGQFADNINIKEDGFSVKDTQGTPKWVQARSQQNGYYSTGVNLNASYEGKTLKIAELDGEVFE